MQQIFSMQIRLLFIAILLGVSGWVFSQSKVTGKVTDGENGQPVAGATVADQHSKKTVATDINGTFILTLNGNEKSVIVISAIGYQTKEIADVAASTEEQPVLNISLNKADKSLQEVIVRTSARRETIASLYTQQKISATIGDGISADVIKRTPDKNTGDVLKRVSGTTVQDNKFVIIRGLSDRYNTALLDGAPLPSTEPNRKAFSFDIIPSNLVDKVIITKTATPDLPGDFAGGAVQVTSKDIPDRNFLTVTLSEGYNTASTFKDFKSGVRNTTDYFGFDNGDKKLSKNFPSSDVIINRQLTSEQSVQAMKMLPQDWNVYSNKALPIQSYQLSAGKVGVLKNNNKIGVLAAVSYRNAQNIYKDLIRDYVDYDYRDNVYKFSTNLGAMANFAYVASKSKITFKNIYNRIYDDQYLYRTGTNRGASADVKFFAFDLMEKSLLKSVLEGTHQLGQNSSKLNWSLSYAKIINDQPDQRKVNYLANVADRGTEAYKYSASVTTLGKENTRMYTHLDENNFSGSAMYTLPLKMFDNQAMFKAGVSSLYRKRDFDARFLGMVLNVNIDPDEMNAIRTRPLNQLYAADVLQNYTLDEIPNNFDSYNAHSLTNAGYLMLDNRIGSKSRVVWGARVEQFDMELESKGSTSPDVKQNYVDVLPSVNYTYSLTPKTNLRASYFRSLARPEFRELARANFFDYELLALLSGNPDLKKATIDNGDIRFEFYPSGGQIISVSGFYKKFTNAIENSIDDRNSTKIVSYFNSAKASVYGAELEIRKTLDFIAETEFMKSTTAYANFSLVKSVVENEATGAVQLEKNRPLVGQAPYVVNAGLQHSFLDDKINFNAVYNRVGRRLFFAAGGLFGGVWDAPRDLVDLQLSVKVLKTKGEVKLNANDLLNQRTTLYYDIDKNKKYSRTADQTFSSYKPGSTFSLAFTYTF